MDEENYTIKDAAQKIHCSERQLRQLCIDGKVFGAYKISDGRKWLIPEHAIEALKNYQGKQRMPKVQQEAPTEAVIKQEPYEETSHKRKMRKLAIELAEKIDLPSLWDKDWGQYLWRDLPVESQPGKYSLPIGIVEINGDAKIKVTYHDVSAKLAEPHRVKGLFGHLQTSGLSKFVELVGDKGRLSHFAVEAGHYSEALMKFLKLVVDEVKGYRAKVTFHDEVKPGLTKWFVMTSWNDAIQKASGYTWIEDWWYKVEGIAGTKLWQLKCGSYIIGIAKSKRTLKTYENWHKKLRGKYADHRLAKDIHAKSQELSNITQDIRQRLQEFSDMERLPGHCELC